VAGAEDLPFNFSGGYVGYFGYELTTNAGASVVHRPATPHAMWIRVSRFVAVDHTDHVTYVIAVVEADTADSAMAWLDRTVRTLQQLPMAAAEAHPPIAGQHGQDLGLVGAFPIAVPRGRRRVPAATPRGREL
jgi:para-aminobenzoate synthetase